MMGLRVLPIAVALAALSFLLLPACQKGNPAYREPTAENADARLDFALKDASPAGDDPGVDKSATLSPDMLIDQTSPPDAAMQGDAATGVTADGPARPNAVSGTIRGLGFPVARAFRIGMPIGGAANAMFVLLESAVDCSDLSTAGWDKIPGMKQILEVVTNGTTPRTYQIKNEADANYLGAGYNPNATSGTITIDTITVMGDMTGSFRLVFGPDTITGTYDASYCASGVEP